MHLKVGQISHGLLSKNFAIVNPLPQRFPLTFLRCWRGIRVDKVERGWLEFSDSQESGQNSIGNSESGSKVAAKWQREIIFNKNRER